MNKVNELAKLAIEMLQHYLECLGYEAKVHFELEGCFGSRKARNINYRLVNHQLKQLNIDGELVPEYWRNQWEYVSLFNGQSPLSEAENLTNAIRLIPQLLKQQGIEHTYIKPVVWNGDCGKLASGSTSIFTSSNRNVHIPNAIQLNISATNQRGENIIAQGQFGELLQENFIRTSLECALLYLPEEEAFERLRLKDKYGLARELCSPIDISGGHQGSIALYKERGKHNQKMGEVPILYGQDQKAILSTVDWQTSARIEHRLGASSVDYNAYINVVFSLLNLIDTIHNDKNKRYVTEMKENKALPQSLYDTEEAVGAITLFSESSWFHTTLNTIQNTYINKMKQTLFAPAKLGDDLKQSILAYYQKQIILMSK